MVFGQAGLTHLAGRDPAEFRAAGVARLPIRDLPDAASQIQNMPDNRNSLIVGVQFEHCLAVQMSPNYSSSIHLSEKFPWCDRWYGWPKFFSRPGLPECSISGHNPDCHPYYTYHFQRMDQAMFVHYRNALTERETPNSEQDASYHLEGLVSEGLHLDRQ